MFEERTHWSGPAVAVVGVLLLVVVLSAVVPLFVAGPRAAAVVAVVVVAGLCALLVTFSTLRTRIDDSALTVGFGPFRERVVLDRITACAPTQYDWKRWGGFGIRGGRAARLYNVAGDAGRAVELQLTDGRRLLFSSPDPEAVCRELVRRRPALGR